MRENLFSVVCEQQRRRVASAVWSAPLLYAYWKELYLDLLQAASLCSSAGWFESHFITNLEDRLPHVEAQIKCLYKNLPLYCNYKITYLH